MCSSDLKQIESGPKGIVVGVNQHRLIYYRAGVTRGNPTGRYWVNIKGRLTHVIAGCRGIYGLNQGHQIFRYRGMSKTFVRNEIDFQLRKKSKVKI